MKPMPCRLDLLGLNQLYVSTDPLGVGKLHHLPGIRNATDERALQTTITKHDQRRKYRQLLSGHTQQAQLAASSQEWEPAVEIMRIGNRIDDEIALPHPRMKIFRLRIEHLIGAKPLRVGTLGLRPGGHQYPRPHCTGELDREMTQPANAQDTQGGARTHIEALQRGIDRDASAE